MNKKACKFLFFAVLAASMATLSGCRSRKPSADMYCDNLYGDPLIGDVPLNADNMGLPMDGDRSLFEPVMFEIGRAHV